MRRAKFHGDAPAGGCAADCGGDADNSDADADQVGGADGGDEGYCVSVEAVMGFDRIRFIEQLLKVEELSAPGVAEG